MNKNAHKNKQQTFSDVRGKRKEKLVGFFAQSSSTLSKNKEGKKRGNLRATHKTHEHTKKLRYK